MIFSNPIFKREFSSAARSWKTNFLIWAYLLLLAFVLLVLWPGGGILSMVSDSGRQIFSLFFCTNLVLMILLVPAFTATSITYERENNTFAALFTTLLTPFNVVSGKLLASILLLVVLVLLSMPIASVCALTGGINLEFMLKIMILMIMTAISYGMVGLACSSLCARSSTAIIMNYAIILFLGGATWLPAALLSNLVGFREVWLFVRNISPFDALFFLLYPDNYKMSVDVQLGDSLAQILNPFNVFIAASALISFVSFVIFYKKILQPNIRSSAPKGEVYTGTKKTLKRKLTWPFYLFDPLKRKKTIRRFANPVFVAEMRSKLFANPKFVLRGVSVIFILSLVLLTLIAFQFGAVLRADTVRLVAIIFQIGVVAMLAPGVSSGLITDEIAGGTFTALRMTPIKPLTVIIGKLKATFFYALIFIVSSLFVLIAMAYLEQQDVWPDYSVIDGEFWTQVLEKAKSTEWWFKLWDTYRRVILWIIVLLLSTVTFLTGGLFASAFSKSTGIATAVSYTIAALICLVSMAPIVMADKMSKAMASFILSFNPIAAAVQITSESSPFEAVASSNLWVYNILALCVLTLFFLTAATARTWYLFHKQN